MTLDPIQAEAADINVVVDPNIFNRVYIPHLDNFSRTQIFFGGSSSGKSVFVVGQRTVIDLMKGGRNYLICRAVARTLKTSVFAQVERSIREFGVQDLFTINKSDMSITCINGYQAIFVGLDDVEKIKSIVPRIGAFTDIVVEEATETEKNTIKQLRKRQRGGSSDVPKRFVLLFNPILKQHWIFTEYFAPIGWEDDQTEYNTPQLSILKTWFVHNRFLTKADVEDLLNEEDKYFSDVYTWGKWGVLGNVIFTNWKVQDLSDMKAQFVNLRNGGDFGFASNPAAIGRSHYDKNHKTIYFFEEFYEAGFTNDQLATEALKMCGKEEIIWDSAEPKSIQELKNAGVNAVAATKGQDSVVFGIQWLQGQTIIVDTKCINMQNELRQYKWVEDKMTGEPVSPPRPVKKHDHLIDGGLRYAYERDMLEVPRKGRQWQG